MQEQSIYFDKKQSLVVKGVLILLLLTHHLFANNSVTEYSLHTIISDIELHQSIAAFMKLCVGGFTFLSAYGITKKVSSWG